MEARARQTAPGDVTLSHRRVHSLLHQLLAEGLAVELHVSGESMSPFIRSGDLLTVSPRGDDPVRRGDVVAFLAGRCSLVIHRVVALDGESVRTRGDAMRRGDGPVPMSEVLGHVSGILRRGRPVRLGLGAERAAIASLSERGWLVPLTIPWRWLARRCDNHARERRAKIASRSEGSD